MARSNFFQKCCNSALLCCCGCTTTEWRTQLGSAITSGFISVLADLILEISWETDSWLLESVVDSSVVISTAALTTCLYWCVFSCRNNDTRRQARQQITLANILKRLIPAEILGGVVGMGAAMIYDGMIETQLRHSDTIEPYLTPFVVAPIRSLIRNITLFSAQKYFLDRKESSKNAMGEYTLLDRNAS